MTSCKKDSNTDCAETVAGIAGSYKITKITLNGADVTSSLEECGKSGVLKFNADKTGSYTESGSGCSTTPQTGTWDVTGSTITSTIGDGASGAVVNNCSSITITTSEMGLNVATTFTKQ